MDSKLILYLIAGVGVLFMAIVVAYVALSKKMKSSDTMQIKQLREGTQEKSFSFGKFLCLSRVKRAYTPEEQNVYICRVDFSDRSRYDET